MKHPCLRAMVPLGAVLTDEQLLRLDTYATWLEQEAMPAGGIGPNEGGRIWERHICDSIAFGLVARPGERALDVGTGVGLPGIPLSIAWPDTRWTLIDRSRRRVDLARRASRVVGATNVEVKMLGVDQVPDTWSFVVTRATFQPDQAVRHLVPVLETGGIAVIGMSHGGGPPSPPTDPHLAVDTKSIEVLDPPAWFLIIRHCE